MNIVYVIHQFYPEFHSGTERFLLNLSSAIQKGCHFPQIVTYSFAADDLFENHDNLLTREYGYKTVPIVAIKHKALPVDLGISCQNAQTYSFALDFLKKQKRWDLVHIAHSMRLTSFAEAALHLGIPYIFTLTDFWLICPKIILQTSKDMLCNGPHGGDACRELCPELDSAFVKFRLDFARELLSGAKYIVAPSRFLAGIFNKEFPNLAIRVVPHGLDHKYLKPRAKTYQKGGNIVFGYCGALLPHKGVHVLIDAFRELNPANAELRLYGAPFHAVDYAELLKNIAGADRRIQFCGTYREEEVGDVLAKIDVMIIPSLCYESYGMVMHEAMACTVPVIASNIGGMPEKILDSVNGFTFRVGDKKDLGSKMRFILENPEQLNKIKNNLKQQVSPLVEEEAYQYERIYRRCLAQS
jgi:glycosyltransferase involved in cell wall biosynthesis